MKHLKTFIKFNEAMDDEITGPDEATFDHSKSPVLRQKVEEYVKSVLYSNQSKVIFDALGIKQPKDVQGSEFDSMLARVEEKAIEYFIKHPHKMPEVDEFSINQMGISGTSANNNNGNNNGVPKITNI